MRWTDEDLEMIYARTSGYCHICHKKLSFQNYSTFEGRGCWEVEHSRAQSRGGSDQLNNLYAACISCNRAKGAVSTRTARKWAGTTRAPLSSAKRKRANAEAAVATGILGFVIGAVVAGPPGAWLGAGFGARFGYTANPDR
jgi:5-methylcytosine-specific restriction endonuclease McrA